MNLWIIYTLGIFTISVHGDVYDDQTARILDVAAHWQPVQQAIHPQAILPHYLSIGTLNTANKLHLAQIAHHNAHLFQQIKGLNPPVTQYRNPFPVYKAQPQPPHHHHHHHFVVPKDSVQHFHTSASNIAQTVVPSNFHQQQQQYITGKPVFNTKPEYITKPEFYNGIHTTLGKVPHQPFFKQMPTMVKAAINSVQHNPSSYRDVILTPPPQPLHGHSTLSIYKQQQFPNQGSGSFSFPNEGVTSYSFFGPASHLVRSKPPKFQQNFYLPQQAIPNFKPYMTKPSTPVHYETSTPSFFGTSPKQALTDNFEPNFSKSPFKEVFPSTTSNPLFIESVRFPPNNQVKSQLLPPIPASVLSPFFQQVHQNNQQFNRDVQQKSKLVKDDFSKNLVPPPFIHLESSTFRSSTTAPSPTRKPITLFEQTKSLEILNKYNIPVISPLQDANNFKYDGNWRGQPQNYTVSSIVSFPTNPPSNPIVTMAPDPTEILKTVNTLTHNSYNEYTTSLRPNSIDVVQGHHRDHLPSPGQKFLPTPHNDLHNAEHNFFTIEDAITPPAVRNIATTPITSNEIQETRIETNNQPHHIQANEIPNQPTTNPTRIVLQTSEYMTPTPSSSPTQSSPPRNRLRGKNRRRRPRPTTPRTTEQPIEEDNRIPSDWQESLNENQHQTTSSTTTRTTLRVKPIRVRTRLQSTLPPADPTLRVIQRNSQKLNYMTSMQNRQPVVLSSTTPTELQRPAIRTTTQAPAEEIASLDEDYPSTTFETHNVNKIAEENQESNSVDSSSSVSSSDQYPTDVTKFSPETVTIHQLPTDEPEITAKPFSINRLPPQKSAKDSSSSNEKIEKHLSHRQRYRYKTKPTAEVPSVQIYTEEPAETDPSPSPTTSPITTTDSIKSITRLRPQNKYRAKDRPRFSVKEYRQRVKTQSNTTSTEALPTSSTTPGYRSRLRFPTRKRLLPSLRLQSSTTEKTDDADNTIAEVIDNPNGDDEFTPDTATTSTTSTTTPRTTTQRRGYNTRRNSINRFRTSSSTETTSSTEDQDEKKPINRQRTRERFTHKTRVEPNSSKEALNIDTPKIEAKIEDLNNITIETETVASVTQTESNKMESAIMKIIKTDHSNRQSSEIGSAENDSRESIDLNQSPSEQSERVAQLTLSGSAYKFNNLNKNSLSRRIPGYFTLATEDPILPIEAFFPNVKSMSYNQRR